VKLSKHSFEALRSDEEFILYRGRRKGGQSGILVLAPATHRPGPKSLKRLNHEYAFREALRPAWAGP
jgi:hypothetical protein